MQLTIDKASFQKLEQLSKTLNVSYKKLAAEFLKVGIENYLAAIAIPGSGLVERIGNLEKRS